MKQFPNPGEHLLFFRGDIAFFSLTVDPEKNGKAFLRTNLGKASVQRNEIILNTEKNVPPGGEDWHDIEMYRVDDTTFSLSIALTEVGHFEAKCFFFNKYDKKPVWVEGNNISINIEPAEYCCANSLYCAFVRQFGPNQELQKTDSKDFFISGIERLDAKGYTVIPPSGTFRDLIKELDFIIDDLNCRIIHLLPINPVPTVYARMGRYGSPYASLDFTGIDPALAEFDKKATPLEQFYELVDAVHLKNAKIFLDIAINHTGWAAKIHEEHPEWLVRSPDGEIHSPGAWGVVWGDLTELNHDILELWSYLAEMFLVWCGRGVDGFRCDAGYMIPVRAWQYIIAKVRMEYPDTIFLLEGLGGDPAVTRELLNKANMNWAYSELFQNYSKNEINSYASSIAEINLGDGIMMHYAETHDNNRLAANSHVFAKMRTGLSAMLSANGAFGFTNGVEWFAEEKIDVHQSNALNWGAEDNQVDFISRLNSILQTHPSFFNNAFIKFIETHGTSPEVDRETLGFFRYSYCRKYKVLILVNLNCAEESLIIFDKTLAVPEMIDLISGNHLKLESFEESKGAFMLQPGQILCLSENISDMHAIDEHEDENILSYDRIAEQSAMAMALDIITWKRGTNVLLSVDPKKFSEKLIEDPENFCSFIGDCNSLDDEYSDKLSPLPFITWNCESDLKRDVMVPPDHGLLLIASSRFRAKFAENNKIIVQRGSLLDSKGRHFALITPFKHSDEFREIRLNIALYSKNNLIRDSSSLILLPDSKVNQVTVFYENSEIRKAQYLFMANNGRGGMCRANIKWGELSSKYDALLSANLNNEIPVDRFTMWTRCRIHLVYHAHTQELNINTLNSFKYEKGKGLWDFRVPAGNGLFVNIRLTLSMIPEKNATVLTIKRKNADNEDVFLNDDFPVRIILRPDLENRNFHHDTEATHDLKEIFEKSLKKDVDGIVFSPSDARFSLKTTKGTFEESFQWTRGVFHEVEKSRGLKAEGDLFSPGFFDVTLSGNESVLLLGEAITHTDSFIDINNLKDEILKTYSSEPDSVDIQSVLVDSLEQFIVKRNDLKTVIAGYPWFLDWGRDTLICCRGLIAAGMFGDVEKILMQFAKFAEKGTLPNIIYGENVGNRDTSDAPLWLFTACRDFCENMNLANLTEKIVPDRGKTLIQILESIAEDYINGTPNGIKVDVETGLVFSPSHFTWMDTNYPAGTPREGYPIEIQALWFSALNFLFEQTKKQKWKDLSLKVRKSVIELYLNDEGWLSDCLHSKNGESAKKAKPDDALRCNQLFAITLGLIENCEIQKSILKATSSLLVPGAIRTLADRNVEYPLPIDKDHKPLNDPYAPYWGYYEGDEDTRRKPAYHNGTAWTWPFPSYAEAYIITYGEEGKKTAEAILSSSIPLLNRGCVGHIPEILDGNSPHLQRGCDAQAWGVSELLRVWKILTAD